MYYDYLSLITRKYQNGRLMFKLEDIKKYLIDDIESILEKVNYIINFNINDNDEYISTYSFILLIAFSNDYRTFYYKLFLIYSTIDKINDIIHPEAVADKARTLIYLSNKSDYTYKKNNIDTNTNNNEVKDIIYKEIENSFNIDIIRQII